MDIKLVERIKKLLALSQSSNENEAHLAILKAQMLLAKHKLTMKEVNEFKINNSSVKEKVSGITFTKAKWKAHLAQIIADNFGCYIYFKTYRSNKIVFLGREEDALICNIVLEYAIDCINSNVQRIRYIFIKKGCSTKGVENDFALGFTTGMQHKFEEQKNKNQECALILVKDNEVNEAYYNKKFVKSVDTTVEVKRDEGLFTIGYKEGRKFSISDKIASSDDTEPEQIRELSC